MPGMLVTLPVGIVLIVLGFVLLYRFTPLNGKHAAAVIALLALAAYLPVVLIRWPGSDVFAIHLALYMVTAYILGIISSQRDSRLGAANGPQKWFHWGPAIIVIFFAVIVTMDAVFVTMSLQGMPEALRDVFLPKPTGARTAQTIFPGIVSDHYFQKEEQFTEYLNALEAQKKYGWNVRFGWLMKEPEAGRKALFQVVIEQAEGGTLRNAEIHGTFMRSSDSHLDQSFVMDEATPGVYRIAVALPKPGRWQLQLDIDHGDKHYELKSTTTVHAGNEG